ncbi:MAG: hydroxyisourate hydrolase [Ignavibacteriales bacterium]|nr:hydroxyisourate hydrolase [Ignavibacteriales bacterium]
MKSFITTHVLNTSLGKPAAGITVILEMKGKTGEWSKVASGTTDPDGRINSLFPEGIPLERGTYRLTFETATYFRSVGSESFYPYVQIAFEVNQSSAHYHVPLLLNPYGYSTYRGS